MGLIDDAAALISDDAPMDVESFQKLLSIRDQAKGKEQEEIGQYLEGFIAGIGDPDVLRECLDLAAKD
jgi:hypothetical protein